jgi:DNA-directed RNA polymerase specialized sigma24 family protein
MKPSDVAEILEISMPALKSRLHRARLHVRQRLAEIASAPREPQTGQQRVAP